MNKREITYMSELTPHPDTYVASLGSNWVWGSIRRRTLSYNLCRSYELHKLSAN